MKMKTCLLEMSVLLFLAALLSFGTVLEKQQQKLSDGMIRLHVRADSNSPEDQAVKLKVRDVVLACTETMLENCSERDDAMQILRDNLTEIEKTANAFLLVSGSNDRVCVTLKRELFGTRYYDTFALPGGYYDSLLVEIESGEGRNWWCVVYPNICTASVSDIAVPVMRSDGEMMIFPDENGEYDLRFKTLELFENLMGWIRGRREGIPTSR